MFFFQLRNELWKLFGKKRTYIGFIMFVLTQALVILLFKLTKATTMISRTLNFYGIDPTHYISILTVSTVMVAAMAFTLLPLYAALVGGDLVAKEAEEGTLRMILCRPISRLRMLLLKWLAGAIFSVTLVGMLGLFGLAFAAIWFPWGDLFSMPPFLPFGILNSKTGLECYSLALLCMIPKALTIMTLAFMFSCFNMKPASATILAISLTFISGILQDIPFFSDYVNFFFSYHMNVWREVFAEKIPWWKVGQSMSFLFGYNVTFLVIGCAGFQMRDIKS